jgi:uncharacterized membrane protein YphA (DoxX/SURF4 family)
MASDELEPASWFLSRRVFLALLGVVYGIAFLSLFVQVDGLYGSQGIQPIEGPPGDVGLQLACGLGLVLAVLLMLGVAPRPVALLLWAGYLWFFTQGSPFLGFQWDVLLLESGLLAVLYAPGGWLPFRCEAETPPAPVVRWLLVWLLFRLMFLSGAVKLASQDPVWSQLTALELHYWTQPLPHRLSHHAHHLPRAFQMLSVAVMFWIELVLPFFVFGPQRLRRIACAGFLGLMLLITATGNYGFFNLLTAVLCVPMLDDRTLRRCLPILRRARRPLPAARGFARVTRVALGVFGVLVVTLTATKGLRRLGLLDETPTPLLALEKHTYRLASFNAYGLFADMTELRPEIVIEGSLDGEEWRTYRFRYKPGDVEHAPAWAGPHMPRLDWQMWFAALRGPTASPEGWYKDFLRRLLEGSAPVLGLLDGNPFPDEPPRYVRSRLYLYEFGSPEERAVGRWWRREPVGSYCPTLARDEQGRIGWSR